MLSVLAAVVALTAAASVSHGASQPTTATHDGKGLERHTQHSSCSLGAAQPNQDGNRHLALCKFTTQALPLWLAFVSPLESGVECTFNVQTFSLQQGCQGSWSAEHLKVVQVFDQRNGIAQSATALPPAPLRSETDSEHVVSFTLERAENTRRLESGGNGGQSKSTASSQLQSLELDSITTNTHTLQFNIDTYANRSNRCASVSTADAVYISCSQAQQKERDGNSGLAIFGLPSLSTGRAMATLVSLVSGPYTQSLGQSSVIVVWRVSSSDTGRVRLGTSPTSLTNTFSASGNSADAVVSITGLKAETSYFFEIVSGSIGRLATGSFTTLPRLGAPTPLRMHLLGDPGTSSNVQDDVLTGARAFITSTGLPDMVVLLGDNAYADGTDAEYTSRVFGKYQADFATTPMYAIIGNHDSSSSISSSTGVGRGPYFQRFITPRRAEAGGLASGSAAYYSLDFGRVHVVCLDSYMSDLSSGGKQATWLKADLAALKPSTTNWLIALWHHAPYSKGGIDSDNEGLMITMRRNFLPIMEAAGVDLVVGGHSHNYERSMLVNGHYGAASTFTSANLLNSSPGTVVKPYVKLPGLTPNRGTVAVVAGSSGKVDSSASGNGLMHPANSFIGASSKRGLYVAGSLFVDVTATRLIGTFVGKHGETIEAFCIEKPVSPTPTPTATSSHSPTPTSAESNSMTSSQTDTNSVSASISPVESTSASFTSTTSATANPSATCSLSSTISASGSNTPPQMSASKSTAPAPSPFDSTSRTAATTPSSSLLYSATVSHSGSPSPTLSVVAPITSSRTPSGTSSATVTVTPTVTASTLPSASTSLRLSGTTSSTVAISASSTPATSVSPVESRSISASQTVSSATMTTASPLASASFATSTTASPTSYTPTTSVSVTPFSTSMASLGFSNTPSPNFTKFPSLQPSSTSPSTDSSTNSPTGSAVPSGLPFASLTLLISSSTSPPASTSGAISQSAVQSFTAGTSLLSSGSSAFATIFFSPQPVSLSDTSSSIVSFSAQETPVVTISSTPTVKIDGFNLSPGGTPAQSPSDSAAVSPTSENTQTISVSASESASTSCSSSSNSASIFSPVRSIPATTEISETVSAQASNTARGSLSRTRSPSIGASVPQESDDSTTPSPVASGISIQIENGRAQEETLETPSSSRAYIAALVIGAVVVGIAVITAFVQFGGRQKRVSQRRLVATPSRTSQLGDICSVQPPAMPVLVLQGRPSSHGDSSRFGTKQTQPVPQSSQTYSVMVEHGSETKPKVSTVAKPVTRKSFDKSSGRPRQDVFCALVMRQSGSSGSPGSVKSAARRSQRSCHSAGSAGAVFEGFDHLFISDSLTDGAVEVSIDCFNFLPVLAAPVVENSLPEVLVVVTHAHRKSGVLQPSLQQQKHRKRALDVHFQPSTSHSSSTYPRNQGRNTVPRVVSAKADGSKVASAAAERSKGVKIRRPLKKGAPKTPARDDLSLRHRITGISDLEHASAGVGSSKGTRTHPEAGFVVWHAPQSETPENRGLVLPTAASSEVAGKQAAHEE